MNALRRAAIDPVRHDPHPLPARGRIFLHGHGHDLIAGRCRKRGGEMPELAGEILVEEKYAHGVPQIKKARHMPDLFLPDHDVLRSGAFGSVTFKACTLNASSGDD
jgi:hypothetical protein